MGQAILSMRRNFCVAPTGTPPSYEKYGLTMILYGVPSDIARNILDITFHT